MRDETVSYKYAHAHTHKYRHRQTHYTQTYAHAHARILGPEDTWTRGYLGKRILGPEVDVSPTQRWMYPKQVEHQRWMFHLAALSPEGCIVYICTGICTSKYVYRSSISVSMYGGLPSDSEGKGGLLTSPLLRHLADTQTVAHTHTHTHTLPHTQKGATSPRGGLPWKLPDGPAPAHQA